MEETALKDYFLKARREMVAGQLNCCGVHDKLILNSFLTIPREEYLPSFMQSYAYAEMDHILPDGSIVMNCRLLALLIQLAQIDPALSIAHVGSDYGQAILEDMGCKKDNGPHHIILVTAGMIVDENLHEQSSSLSSPLLQLFSKLKPDGRLAFIAGPSDKYGYAYILTKRNDTHFSLVRHFDAWTLPILHVPELEK